MVDSRHGQQSPISPTHSHSRLLLRLVLLAVFVFLIARLSWLSDDALINLRTILNMTHGWGPGFNAYESVQAYTHPLWFLTWMALGSITGEWILTVLLIGIACSTIAVAIALWIAPHSVAIIATFAVLIFSSAFADFATSGLENPMSFLGLGTLFLLIASVPERNFLAQWVVPALVGMTSAAVVLTRLDLALFVGPVLLWFALRNRKDPRSLALTLGFLVTPIIVWGLWSLATYGSLLPNTYTAKTNLLIPRTELVIQGFRYVVFSVERDLVSGLAILAALLLAFSFGSTLMRLWAVGIVLYLGYTMWVGGDFMAGRFLAVPVYVSALLIASSSVWRRAPDENNATTPRREVLGVATAATVLLVLVPVLGATGLTPSALNGPSGQRFETIAGINDERGYWTTQFRHGWYWFMTLGTSPPVSEFRTVDDVTEGDGRLDGMSELVSTNSRLQPLREYTARWPTYDGEKGPTAVGISCGSLATGGLLTGPQVHWIDECALTDAYLAEQSYYSLPFRWVPGHFIRRIPEGYEFAVLTGDATLMADAGDAADLQKVWDRVRR